MPREMSGGSGRTHVLSDGTGPLDARVRPIDMEERGDGWFGSPRRPKLT